MGGAWHGAWPGAWHGAWGGAWRGAWVDVDDVVGGGINVVLYYLDFKMQCYNSWIFFSVI